LEKRKKQTPQIWPHLVPLWPMALACAAAKAACLD